MRAYHFLQYDMTTSSGDEPAWTVGETRTIPANRKIIPCEYGYHASPTLFDALTYAPGSIACVVELDGDVTPHGNPPDKYAARSRTLIAAVDLTVALRLFAADCAEKVLPIFEKERPNDDRPRKAIEAARAYAGGEIDAAAVAAAWAAGRDAAMAAGRAAKRDAARDAARAAAMDAARAWDAAWAAERAWQRQHFNATVLPLLTAE